MIRIPVATQGGAYEAMIENGLLQRAGAVLRDLLGRDRRLFVVTVPPVKRRWGKMLMASLSAARCVAKMIEMPDGEPHKRLATLERLAGQLIHLGADRNAGIVAFGGGVVGDVAGFLASVYMRGIDLVQIPTTVLAQVDASIGGKTGVNLTAGKNLVGSFRQPKVILIDPHLLSTLPAREFRSGLYESLKCGIIGSPALFDLLEKVNSASLRQDASKLEWVIGESVKIKARIVLLDERETGLRQVLNFGHTIGHALEAQSRYRRYLHGEAIAWGMLAEISIAAAIGKCDAAEARRMAYAILAFGDLPPVRAHGKEILKLLQHDKKNRRGKVHFALPRKIEEIEIVSDVPDKFVIEAVEELRGLKNRKVSFFKMNN